ncbi:GNAT family N-acetyltransferase [Nocardioides bruguierae]|uniref:GNAT family N-acetyltransferase n=1 Tax=Nocardioides bruguierae TaxID=2945102 RepID=A0A9X2D6T1_9ACTN|nr:GNAT family N-acetyltransferase [Nocardioides bruguierae]MCM0620221.1 GNAT family N-acetyltransferase [Nocardioides bruguierae]
MPDDAATVPLPTLPAGYRARRLVLADAAAVTAVVAAQDVADTGEVMVEEADVVGDWQRPSFDLATSAVGVETVPDDAASNSGTGSGAGSGAGSATAQQPGVLVAVAEVHRDRAEVAVHPDHRDRGLGTALDHWVLALARARGERSVGSPVLEGSAGDRLLADLGWAVRWHSWVLALPEGVDVPERPLPAGYTARAAAPEEHRACWTLNEDAFLEWSDRPRDGYEDWAALTVERPGFEPWQLRVVVDEAGEVVALALVQMMTTEQGGRERTEAYVARLATRADQRGRGLAQALLVDVFAEGRRRGASLCTLSTDSRTGALGLYEKVGMRVTSSWVNRAAALD